MRRHKQKFILVFIVLTCADLCAAGHPGHTANADAVPTCRLPSPDCGHTPTPAFGPDGRLWLAYEQNGHVYVTHSKDQGQSFASSIAVNRVAETIYTNGENRPKIALDSKGGIFVSWTEKTPGRFSGNIRFTRSLDAGRRFDDPVTINTDSALIGHRFDALAINERDEIYLVWLDKRDQLAARKSGRNYSGAALYYAVSKDRGARFSKNIKVADNSCECCRIALAVNSKQNVAAFWRHIFDKNTRDHALVTLGPKSPLSNLKRATFDNWQVDSCPHHGPDLDSDDRDRLHMVWFTQGTENQGILYARYNPATQHPEYQRTMARSAGASHPQVLSADGLIYSVWKAFNGKTTELVMVSSNDGGESWSGTQVIATSDDASDHPILIKHQHRVFVSWHTAREGYRLIQVNP